MTIAKDVGSPGDAAYVADALTLYQLVSHLGCTLDEKRPEDLRRVFTKDIRFHFGERLVEGVDEVVKRGEMLAGRFARIQHVITNIIVAVNGDAATVRANLVATHVYSADLPGQHYDSGGVYRFECARTASGWRIARASLQNVWTNGSWDPPQA
jgi:hypothetical protein